MAVPVLSKTGAGSNKTAGTSLVVTLTSTAYAVGDYVAVGFGMDILAGTVSFAIAGTAVIGAWTVAGADTTLGSGTTGLRSIFSYARVTTAGTITTVTVTHPSVTARAAQVWKVAGAHATTPVAASATLGNNASGVAATIAGGLDIAWLNFDALEGPSADVTSAAISPAGSWVAGTLDTASVGTTGGAASSNISTVSAWWTWAAATAGTYTSRDTDVTLNRIDTAVAWQGAAGVAAATPVRRPGKYVY